MFNIRLIIVAAALVAVPSRVVAQECLTYGRVETVLTGYLTRHHVESRALGSNPVLTSDTRWMLYTPEPFCVDAAPDSGDIPVRGASIVEIWSGDDSRLVPLIGQRVKVIGSLVPTYLPHYHAYLIMQAESIGQAREAGSEP